MSDLKDLISKKKESKDYVTLQMGMITEEDCFKGIEFFGNHKFAIKEQIKQLIDKGEDPNSSKMKELLGRASQIHYLQLQIINDVCARFEVIHPEMLDKNISEELLRSKRKYWDWYKELYKKVHGSYPEIL